MSRFIRFAWPGLALSLVLVGCSGRFPLGGGSQTVPELMSPGKKTPETAGTDSDGRAFKLSDYRGKVVLLNFWFST